MNVRVRKCNWLSIIFFNNIYISFNFVNLCISKVWYEWVISMYVLLIMLSDNKVIWYYYLLNNLVLNVVIIYILLLVIIVDFDIRFMK